MKIHFNAAIVKEDIIYFSAKDFNGLFKFDLKKNAVQFINHFPNDEIWTEYLHQYAFELNQSIYFIPFRAHQITKFDINSQTYKNIDVYKGCDTASISSVLEYNDKYIFIPYRLCNPVLIFDTNEDSISECPIIAENICIDSLYSDIYGAIVANHDLLITVYGTDKIFKRNLFSDKWEIVCVPNTKNSAITYFENRIWLVSSDGKEVNSFTPDFRFIKKYKLSATTSRPFESWINSGDYLFLCGCLEDEIRLYDKGKDDWIPIQLDNVRRNKSDWAFGCGYFNLGDKIYVCPSATDRLIEIGRNSSRCIEIEYNDSDLFEKIKTAKGEHYFGNGFTINMESNELGLGDLVDYLSRRK